jgi:hypothetical protein
LPKSDFPSGPPSVVRRRRLPDPASLPSVEWCLPDEPNDTIGQECPSTPATRCGRVDSTINPLLEAGFREELPNPWAVGSP